MENLTELEAELAALQERVRAKRAEVREKTMDALRAMLESGTLTVDDLKALLPPPNPHKRKPGPKPKAGGTT